MMFLKTILLPVVIIIGQSVFGQGLQEVLAPTFGGANMQYYMARLVGETEKVIEEQQIPADSLSDRIAILFRIDTLGRVCEWRYIDNTLSGRDSIDVAPATAATCRAVTLAASRLDGWTPAERNGRKINYTQRLRIRIPVEKIAKKQDAEPLLFLGEDPDKNFWDWVYTRVRYDDRFSKVGGVVHVRFFVEPNGAITIGEVFKSPDDKLSKEVIRVIRNSKGKWTPRCVRGVPQRTEYIYRCNFINDTH